jgi:hypothetical protein
VAAEKVATPLALPAPVVTVCEEGHVITGFSLSRMVTTKLQTALFLASSDVVHTTRDTPAEKSYVLLLISNAPTLQVAAKAATLSDTAGAGKVIDCVP